MVNPQDSQNVPKNDTQPASSSRLEALREDNARLNISPPVRMTSMPSETLKIQGILVVKNTGTEADRDRKEMGDVDGLANSIRENGLIHPIVLARGLDGDPPRLVVGERRLTALRRLGRQTLFHGKDYLWRDEANDPNDMAAQLRLKAVELEENIRRKPMTWQEEVASKAKLLAIMQKIHGVAQVGGRTREELRTGESKGFSERKLAALLGESPATTSRDIQLAGAVEALPELKRSDSKSAAMQRVSTIVASLNTRGEKVTITLPSLKYQIIVDCRDEKHQRELLDRFQKEALPCRALIT